MLETKPLLLKSDFPALRRGELSTLQVNLGYTCNLSCTHCHVNAGPKRTEQMDLATVELVLDVLKEKGLSTLDLTGGAPEMNPHFRYLVKEARKMGVRVIDRCNLTILSEPGYEDLADFLAEYAVDVVASLPCYAEKNVSEQRGKGVFERSISALQKLNTLGYGREGTGLELSLVYNPNGAFLPPGQIELQKAYKKELAENYDLDFNQLLTITNMPISRFGSMLLSKNLYNDYMKLLKDNYSKGNLQSVMCRSIVSVDYQGHLYDCDFNQMLDLPMTVKSSVIATDRSSAHLSSLLEVDISGNAIVVADHCYGCTAGQGSSCGGALE